MHVIDSHTGGMPTRVILDGGPDLGTGPLSQRALMLARDHAAFRTGILKEPRGQAGMVAALLVPPQDPTCIAGVIYFDADAVLGMCGHGTIGLAVTLARLGRMAQGIHRVETPAGVVTVQLHDPQTVSVTNIESRRIHGSATLQVPGHGDVTGDMAYGGNWFFITDSPIPVTTANIPALTQLAVAIRMACHLSNLTGSEGQQVDHVILAGNSPNPATLRRNFVLCPDDEYDRSPCGTGSSALIACLAASGALDPGDDITLESVIGSAYRLSYQPGPTGGVIPRITGQAHVMAESTLVFDPADPFRDGIL